MAKSKKPKFDPTNIDPKELLNDINDVIGLVERIENLKLDIEDQDEAKKQIKGLEKDMKKMDKYIKEKYPKPQNVKKDVDTKK